MTLGRYVPVFKTWKCPIVWSRHGIPVTGRKSRRVVCELGIQFLTTKRIEILIQESFMTILVPQPLIQMLYGSLIVKAGLTSRVSEHIWFWQYKASLQLVLFTFCSRNISLAVGQNLCCLICSYLIQILIACVRMSLERYKIEIALQPNLHLTLLLIG